ncbi:MAG: hypothetical protein WC850_02080 [Candidatus Gracilibacteria bacterium]
MSGSNLDKEDTLDTIPGFVGEAEIGQVQINKVGEDVKSQTEQVLDYKEVNDILDYIEKNPTLVRDMIEVELGREIDKNFKITMTGQGNLGHEFNDILLLIKEGDKETEVYLLYDKYISFLKISVTTMKRLKQEE